MSAIARVYYTVEEPVPVNQKNIKLTYKNTQPYHTSCYQLFWPSRFNYRLLYLGHLGLEITLLQVKVILTVMK